MNTFDVLLKYWPLLAVVFASGGTLYAQDLKIQNLEQAVLQQAAIQDRTIRLESEQKALKENFDKYVEDSKARWVSEDNFRRDILQYLAPRNPTHPPQ